MQRGRTGIEFKPYPFEPPRFRETIPELRDGVEVARHPVVVVGAGPVGLCAALGLAARGVRVVLLEADDSVCIGSRAICISRRSLEIIGRVGAADGFLRKGLAWTGGRSFYRDTEVLRFSMPQDENQKLPPMVNIAQYDIERILLERAQQMPDLVEIRWCTRVTGVESRDDGVTLRVTTPSGDYTLHADWLVAADGGRSFVRSELGLALHGTSYEGRYVIVDILMDSARPTERLAYFDPACNPGSTVLVHKQPDNVWRIDYQLRDGEDPEAAIRPENVAPRVRSLLAMMGETAPWAPVWIGIYKANALTLERYRHGRVLFAGDAAHLLPIFGVRGANSGIDDADNLAWKLAYVVRGLAGENLLDTYSDERVAAAHENLAHGTKSTEFMAPPTFAYELMRKAVLGLASRHPRLRSLINPRQTSAITYVDSPLNANSERFAAGPVPGAVLPECPVTLVGGLDACAERVPASCVRASTPRKAHVTDLLGLDFTALWFGGGAVPDTLRDLQHGLRALKLDLRIVQILREEGAEAQDEAGAPDPPSAPAAHPSAQVADATDLRACDHTGRLFPMYGAGDGTLYLVRPDGHVLGRWRDVRRDACVADMRIAIERVLSVEEGG